jgi:serine/threonine protein kinase
MEVVYTPLTILGEGNFGCVIKARDSTDGTFVAIKQVEYFADERDQVLLEADIHSELRHPKIITCIKTWTSNIGECYSFKKRTAEAGLPNGIFSNQIFRFGLILESLGRDNVGIFIGHFEYITAIWYILGPLGSFLVIWCIFPRFGICMV